MKWIVEGLIPAGVPGVFAARANVGKSLTALLIGLSLASGRGVLGRAVSPDVARGVIYVGLEDDAAEFQRRFRRGLDLLRQGERWGADEEEALSKRFVALFPAWESGAAFSLEAQWKIIAAKASAIPGGCGLIVLDTLARLNEGDENSAHEVRRFLAAQSALAATTGASVIAIHHVKKGADATWNLQQRLSPEILRGSSAIEAAARFILTMAALTPQEALVGGLTAADARDDRLVALKLVKASQGEKGLTLLLERCPVGRHGAGFLVPHADSDRVLASILAGATAIKFTGPDKVLLAIARSGGLKSMDQATVAAKIWPDSKNPKSQWDKHLSALRRKGVIDGHLLTDAGWTRSRLLGFHGNPEITTKSSEEPAVQGTSTGSLEAEGAEVEDPAPTSFHSTPP